MNSILSTVLVTFGVAGMILLILYAYGKYLLSKKQDSPASHGVLRSPGQSLLSRIHRLDLAVKLGLVGLIGGVCLLPAGHLTLSYFAHAPESFERTLTSAGGGALFLVLLLLSWLRLRGKLRDCHLVLEGEQAVGNALKTLTEKGYLVYHDFPAEQSNIGHIVIGPAGVLAVETKARPSDPARRRKGDPIVNYDGRMLHFPKNSDYQTIDHAKDQAHWLSQWLSEAVGDPISARAIVAIPGWHVKRTSAEGIPVVNPKQFTTLFEHIKPRPLSDDMIQRISQCIEQQSMAADESLSPN